MEGKFRVSSSNMPILNSKLRTRNSKLATPPVGSNQRRTKVILSVVASLVGLWLVAWGAAKLLNVRAPLAHADAIVVMSGSAAFVERNTLAAQFYNQGRGPKVILTNDNQRSAWSSAEQRNPFFFERAVTLLGHSGVPAEAIEVVPQPIASTRDEALQLRQYAESRGLKSLLVVTSEY